VPVVAHRPSHLPRPAATRRHRRALVAATVALFVLALLAALGLRWLTADLPSPGQLLTRAAPDTTKIYDRQGRLLFEVLDPRAGRRTRVALADVPPVLRQAVIAVEDEGFYRNPGSAGSCANRCWLCASPQHTPRTPCWSCT
jgi:membrane peptidoglycan carboxypeptidase